MSARILLIALASETDIVVARKRTQSVARLLGFDSQDQVRITTAVSEIARNAFEYAGGGEIEFRIVDVATAQFLEVAVRDKGAGIADLKSVLLGCSVSASGLGLGLSGARRLMDRVDIETAPLGGTTVRMGKQLPVRAGLATAAVLRRVAEAIAAEGPIDVLEEIRQQNRQILLQFETLQERHDQLKLLNQELQDTNRGVVALYAELDERADHLRRADELKSKFLSHMSHEFRTPLNSIMALSRLLLTHSDGELTGEQEKQIQYIQRAAQNLTELVDDLLDLAKVEAGKIVVSPSRFTAEGLFGALRGMLRPLLVGSAVALVFDDPVGLPELNTDEAKLSQILRNFISNALKFTERGEVRVSAVGDAAAGTATFTVRDTGIGIDPADVELIFQEFTQVEHPLQGRVKGTGLGLPLARKLAGLLGGGITVESTPGQGSKFSVTLPCVYHKVGEQEPVEPAWVLETGKIPILVVEDDPTDAFIVERVLSGSRYQMLHARTIGDAQLALEQLRPAAMVLDVVLLGEESWRLILRLRQSETLADLPVVVVSAGGDEQKALHLGADHFLGKPIMGDRLLSLLDRLTGRHGVTDVLMIDDEEVAHYLVRQLLAKSRFGLRQARDGADGLRQMRQMRPDAVVLDINMADMSGLQLLERVAADPALADIPTIVLTSAVLQPADRLCLRHAAAILSKSELSDDVLENTIDRVLSRPGGAT